MSLIAGPLAIAAERRFGRLPALPKDSPSEALPSLSIIIPARNEASNLLRLLPSLAKISYPGSLELIVVDDCSTDETALIARSHKTRLIQLGDLPPGWSGKTFACHQGAMAAEGEWLLFTDADTIHHPSGPADAVSYAIEQGLDGLSIFFKHTFSGAIDSLALSVAFAGLFAGMRDETPIMNGQYILLRRQAYEKVGGFASVAGQRVEDLALGNRLRLHDFDIRLLRSDHAAEVQMYSDVSSLWQGLTRFGPSSLRWLGSRSLLVTLFISGVMTPILSLLATLVQRRNRKWAALSWAAVAVGFIPWSRRFGSAWLAPLAPFGALLVQAASVFGLVRRLMGLGTSWKGRRV